MTATPPPRILAGDDNVATTRWRQYMRGLLKHALTCAGIAGAGLLGSAGNAWALPNFAAQTGQPCSACHIGAFGPQLTPFGRAFKLSGYTTRGGDGLGSKIPLSGMVLGSFNNTAKDFPAGSVPQHYGPNNNFALDQISLFLAGGIGEHSGGFVQGTYSDINNAFHLDQVDLRPYTTTVTLNGAELRLGTTISNAPTVTDPFNSTFAWGFPYVASALAPSPAAQPILVSGFVANSIGATGYLWYDRSLYFEAGGFESVSPYALARFGTTYGAGRTEGLAPYVRTAYEWNWNNQSAHIGGLFMQASAFPASGRVADRSNGSDQYTDLGIDGGYQWYGDGTNTWSIYGIYVNEDQQLKGSTAASNNANGTTLGSNYSLNQFRLEASYWYQNTYGFTLGWQKSWGPQNPILYSGNANSKPNSNAFLLEADWVPFGKQGAWGSPWTNLKLGVQYVAYTQFNGAAKNYDGAGRNAADNNTLYIFSWLAF
ncbi:MAG: hypothetical protein KGL55_13890 [Rhodospirillales bacterium]|nr:hypothetical protein [Rhodospirillales bacterium]